jgi:hypothetical protein
VIIVGSFLLFFGFSISCAGLYLIILFSNKKE